ncbi:MAG: protein kinase [Nitrospirae bacterium]|nr:protein kinase [Nitrospirota bacterium]
MADQLPLPPVPIQTKMVIAPSVGEVITSLATRNSYTMGERIGEGSYGVVYSCVDGWANDLAAKVLKPTGPYEKVRASAEAEIQKLLALRHPHITYVFDAFEFRDTFYIITERCYCPLTQLFSLQSFDGKVWLMPVARCLLQAVQYLHLNQYAHQDIHMGNVFAAFSRDEMRPTEPGAIQFKLGDLGVSKVFSEIDASNTLADWMRPPEALDPGEFGPMDHRIDIYHIGLLLLQLAQSKQIQFSREEILGGRPREMALELPPPLNFALEKALRRHVPFRTETAMELWRDLHSPPGGGAEAAAPVDGAA